MDAFWDQLRNAPLAAQWFTLGAVILWALVFRSAWRRAEHWTLALVVATGYCFVGEYLAIRLGKYHYAPFALSVPEFDVPGLERLFAWLSDLGLFPRLMMVDGISRHVPVEVALLEGALLYSIFRITNLLSPQLPRGQFAWRRILPWLRERWPNPVLNGALVVSLDATLDAVVSGTMSIDGTGPTAAGLGLWTWHTNAHYAGHWFGVPLANYNAWFAALFAFTIATRVGPRFFQFGGTVLEQGKDVLWASLKAVLLLNGLLFLVKFSLDYLAYEAAGLLGAPTPAAWQFAIVGALIVAGGAAAGHIAVRAVRKAEVEWVTIAPIAFVFLYRAGALVLGGVHERSAWLAPLWVVTALIAAVHAGAPWKRARQPVGLPPVAAGQESGA